MYLLVFGHHMPHFVPREGDLWCEDVRTLIDVDAMGIHPELQTSAFLVLQMKNIHKIPQLVLAGNNYNILTIITNSNQFSRNESH